MNADLGNYIKNNINFFVERDGGDSEEGENQQSFPMKKLKSDLRSISSRNSNRTSLFNEPIAQI